MGYLHIGNLYKTQDLLLFRECYALEKVHGTSAHITCKTIPLCSCGHPPNEHLMDKDTGEDVCCHKEWSAEALARNRAGDDPGEPVACSCRLYTAGSRKGQLH